MTINQRINHLRKNVLHLNQTDFSKTIGMKQTGVSYMEQKDATVTDQAIKSICAIHNVSEQWLRYGIGSIFIEPDTFSLDGFVDSKGGTAEEKEMLKEAIQLYFEFEPYVRQSLLNTYMNKVHPKQTRNPLFDGIPDTPEELERMYPVIDMNKNNKDIG